MVRGEYFESRKTKKRRKIVVLQTTDFWKKMCIFYKHSWKSWNNVLKDNIRIFCRFSLDKESALRAKKLKSETALWASMHNTKKVPTSLWLSCILLISSNYHVLQSTLLHITLAWICNKVFIILESSLVLSVKFERLWLCSLPQYEKSEERRL